MKIEPYPYELRKTCNACPEQYDVFLDNEKVAYLMLRHGYFYADVPNCFGDRVYESLTEGDGMFTDQERFTELKMAITAIDKHLKHTAKET